MKQLFYLSLAFLAITGCRKIEMDGEKEIFVVTKEVTPVGVVSNIITLSGKITKDTTLYAKDVNYLSGLVYITKGVTLTIQEGAKVQGKSGIDVASLVICRGAKLIAKGTADKPIVFTSASANPQSGDWGGVVLLGTAKVNQALTWKGAAVTGLTSVEGGVNDTEIGYGLAGSGDAAFPTGNDADNSGILQYVRIEYAGYAYQPDNELNSLTMAGVGSGTTIDHIQVTYAKDDAFEWFGGTVNCKHLIAYKTQDDDFDTDNGYSGKVQFGIALRDSTIADISRSEAFESDNDAGGSLNSPQTKAVFSNMTVIGPRATLANNGNSLYLAAAHVRRNTGISIYNSVFLGWPAGLLIDGRNGRAVQLNVMDSTVRFKNNIIAGCGPVSGTDATSYSFVGATGATWTADSVKTFFGNTAFSNKVLTNITDAKIISPFSYSAPDFIPFGGSNGNQDILTGASFADANLTTGFSVVKFRGACDAAGVDANWWKGWTRFINQ